MPSVETNTQICQTATKATQTRDSDDDYSEEFPLVLCQDPLQNCLVLQEVFSHLNLNDLKNCRSVCRQWRDVSISSLKKCAQIKLTSEAAVTRFTHFESLHGFGNYRMNLFTAEQEMLSRFGRLPCSDFLREVCLHAFGVKDLILPFLTLHRHTLERLIIVFPGRNGFFWNMPQELKFDNSILPFPKLKEVSYRAIRVPQTQLERQALISILVASPLLEKVSVQDHVISKFLLDHLETWSSTLTKLEIGPALQNYPEFPLMKKLKQISLFGTPFPFPQLSRAPILQEIRVDSPRLRLLFPSDLTTTRITVLRVTRFPHMVGWNGFTSEMFPCLKTLEFHSMTNRLFRTVCANIKTLEELRIVSSIRDYSITGTSNFGNKKNKLAELVKAAKETDFNMKSHQKHPSISDLPRLAGVKIASKELTEASIILGFIYCKSLKSLELHGQMTEISIETMQAFVRAEFPFLQKLSLRAENFYGATESEVKKLLKENLPNCQANIWQL